MPPFTPVPAWVYILAGFLIFASGAATGTFVTMRVFANAHESALVKQKAELDAAKKAEYERAVKDTEQRLAAATRSAKASAKIKAAVKRVPGTCNIPADAMKRLNDPELIGP